MRALALAVALLGSALAGTPGAGALAEPGPVGVDCGAFPTDVPCWEPYVTVHPGWAEAIAACALTPLACALHLSCTTDLPPTRCELLVATAGFR